MGLWNATNSNKADATPPLKALLVQRRRQAQGDTHSKGGVLSNLMKQLSALLIMPFTPSLA